MTAPSGTSAEGFISTGDRFGEARKLGSGGMGVVYAVYDRRREEHVALKAMPRVSPASIYRFKQEFRALCDVAHPNLVVLHELISEGDQWFFTMELLDGVDFLGFVSGGQTGPRKGGAAAIDTFETQGAIAPAASAADVAETLPPPAERALPAPAPNDDSAWKTMPVGGAPSSPLPSKEPSKVVVRPRCNVPRLRSAMRQLTEGLNALHAAGKVHRDVKPSNVMVTREGRVVLLDFGLVADLTSRRESEWREISGTPEYMSPEQMAGQQQVAASDWYSVGVILYEALTGRLPCAGSRERWNELLDEKRKTAMPPPSALVPDVDAALDALCMDLLAGDPARRPTGTEVARRLAGRAAPSPSAAVIAQEALLVGRARHLAALTEAFAAASVGATVTLHVHGASGMGKSVLARSFLDGLLAQDAAVVLEGRCYERESVPYKGLDSLVDALTRWLAALLPRDVEALLPRHIAALTRVFPVLDQVPEIAAMPGRGLDVPDPQELRRRAFGALRELLARIGDRRPLVLYIDDLQWSDLDSAALLGDLLRPPDSPSLLLIGSFRSEARANAAAVQALPQPGAPGYDVRELEVGPLAVDEARALASALLGPALGATHAEAIARESGGSPFFVGELARHVAEHGAAPGSAPGQP